MEFVICLTFFAVATPKRDKPKEEEDELFSLLAIEQNNGVSE